MHSFKILLLIPCLVSTTLSSIVPTATASNDLPSLSHVVPDDCTSSALSIVRMWPTPKAELLSAISKYDAMAGADGNGDNDSTVWCGMTTALPRHLRDDLASFNSAAIHWSALSLPALLPPVSDHACVVNDGSRSGTVWLTNTDPAQVHASKRCHAPPCHELPR
jgi:hypothetical protein